MCFHFNCFSQLFTISLDVEVSQIHNLFNIKIPRIRGENKLQYICKNCHETYSSTKSWTIDTSTFVKWELWKVVKNNRNRKTIRFRDFSTTIKQKVSLSFKNRPSIDRFLKQFTFLQLWIGTIISARACLKARSAMTGVWIALKFFRGKNQQTSLKIAIVKELKILIVKPSRTICKTCALTNPKKMIIQMKLI